MATAGIPTSNILQPGVITVPGGVNLALISNLQLLTPQYYTKYVQKYGTEVYDYFFQWLATFGGMEKVNNQNFFWFESRGKNQIAVSNLNQVNAPAAGAVVNITISNNDLYNGGTQTPLRVGETVYIASSNIAGQILTVPTPNTATVAPKISTQAFVSANSNNLNAGEILIFGGLVDVGEASSPFNPQAHLDQKYSNNTTQIREDFSATDLAELSEVWYNSGVTGADSDMPGGTTQSGVSLYTLKALMKTEVRFINSIESKLMRGDIVNAGDLLTTTSNGTQGFISQLNSNGAETVNYTQGTLDISKLHEITRIMDVNGCAKENVWLQDIFQRQDFSDGIFKEYPAGAFVYGQGETSQEASVAYGFQQILIDGYLLKVKKYSPWNTEVQTGKTPGVDYFRNYGIISPMGTTQDARSYTPMKNIQVMYQEPQKGATVGNAIRVWPWGGGSLNATDGTLKDNITMITYRGVRSTACNQFVIVSA